jgi:hypothetical protein
VVGGGVVVVVVVVDVVAGGLVVVVVDGAVVVVVVEDVLVVDEVESDEPWCSGSTAEVRWTAAVVDVELDDPSGAKLKGM